MFWSTSKFAVPMTPSHTRTIGYLTQIAHELRDLPPQARADEMREIEAHLRVMIEARGDVAGVLAQFGKPRKVGRDLRRAWERKQPESWMRCPWALILGCTFAGWHDHMTYKLCSLHAIQNFFVAHSIFKINAVEVVISLFVGLLIGLISPRRKFAFIAVTIALMAIFDARPYNIYWSDLLITTPLRYEILIPFLMGGALIGASNAKKIDIARAR